MISRFHGQYSFLSNFAPVDIAYEDMLYHSVEHAYVAAKTLNPIECAHIAALDTPAKAKQYGKSIDLRADWNDVRLRVMETLLRKKFNNLHYKTLLLRTGTEDIVEGNTWGDTFWGVCEGEGENNLGKLLMQIRADIRLRGHAISFVFYDDKANFINKL
jgi:ribA/ribD-fused uncharacterized protein